MLQVFLELFIAIRAVGDEVFVRQSLVNDCMHNAVQQGDVGIRLELQDILRMACQVVAARINDDQRFSVFHRIFHESGGDRMIFGRVGANDNNDIRFGYILNRVGDRTRANHFKQGDDRGGVTQARAVIDIVAAETGPHQFLEQVGLFV